MPRPHGRRAGRDRSSATSRARPGSPTGTPTGRSAVPQDARGAHETRCARCLLRRRALRGAAGRTLFSAALEDQTCPPSTVFAAFNAWALDDKAIKCVRLQRPRGQRTVPGGNQAALAALVPLSPRVPPRPGSAAFPPVRPVGMFVEPGRTVAACRRPASTGGGPMSEDEARVHGRCDTRFAAVRAVFEENFGTAANWAPPAITVDARRWWTCGAGGPTRPAPTVGTGHAGQRVVDVKGPTALCAHILADPRTARPRRAGGRCTGRVRGGGQGEGPRAASAVAPAGLSGLREPHSAAQLCDWDLTAGRLAAMEPWWEPEQPVRIPPTAS